MDSWPQEEKMGVVKQAALQGLIKAIGPLWLVCPGQGLCAVLDLCTTHQWCARPLNPRLLSLREKVCSRIYQSIHLLSHNIYLAGYLYVPHAPSCLLIFNILRSRFPVVTLSEELLAPLGTFLRVSDKILWNCGFRGFPLKWKQLLKDSSKSWNHLRKLSFTVTPWAAEKQLHLGACRGGLSMAVFHQACCCLSL